MTSALHWRRHAGCLVLAVAAAIALGGGTAEAKVYFSAFLGGGGTGIERAGFDGGGLETLQFQPVGFADGIALDSAAGRMYWTDTNASVIWSANMNGAEAQIVLDDFGAEPLGIALDTAAHKMYWTDTAGIKRANLTGTEVELVSKGPARGYIALDPRAGRMYWADYPTGTLKTAATTPEAPITNVVSKQPSPFGVALDTASGKLYWLQLNLEKRKTEKNVIRRANVDGSEIQTLIERPGAGFEGGFAIDPAAGRLYWSEAEAHDIATANLDGSGVQALFSTGQDSPEGLAVETASPRPRNLAAPTIEGNVQVGGLASCNPGAWAGTGPIGFAYQWRIAGGAAIEGATGPQYTPTSDQAGARLVCGVSATDAIDTSTASSAAAGIAPLEGPSPAPARTPLIAGIALARMTGSGTSARVPVFTSLAGRASLTAVPVLHVRPRRQGHRAGRSRGRARARQPSRVTLSLVLPAGRSVLTLHHLLPGRSYLLFFTLVSGDGQRASDAARLTVRHR
jgi:Low-density lipoprotein receptor repeat class B